MVDREAGRDRVMGGSKALAYPGSSRGAKVTEKGGREDRVTGTGSKEGRVPGRECRVGRMKERCARVGRDTEWARWGRISTRWSVLSVLPWWCLLTPSP